MGDISDPPIRVVILHCRRYLQVFHLQVGNIIHGDLEVHGDGTDFLPAFGRCRVLQSDPRNNCVLDAPLELFDGPLCEVIGLLVFRLMTLNTLGDFESYVGCRARDREFHNHSSREMVCWECRFHFQSKLKLVL